MILQALAVFLVSSLLSLSAHATGGVDVGNGGDGVLYADEICLTDLYMANLCENPFVGNKIRRDIFKRRTEIKALGQKLGLHEKLFSQKLSDLQALAPELGQLVLDVIKWHDWSFEDREFEVLPDPQFESTYSISRLQIAIRLKHKILISKTLWLRLKPIHRLALVIHEAISSLTHPDCAFSDGCTIQVQSQYAIRRLTAKLFSPDTPITGLTSEDLKDLSVPSRLSEWPKDLDDCDSWIHLSNFSTPYLCHPEDPSLRQKYFAEFCENLEPSKGQSSQLKINMTFYFRPVGIRPNPNFYCAPFGRQIVLSDPFYLESHESLIDKDKALHLECPIQLETLFSDSLYTYKKRTQRSINGPEELCPGDFFLNSPNQTFTIPTGNEPRGI